MTCLLGEGNVLHMSVFYLPPTVLWGMTGTYLANCSYYSGSLIHIPGILPPVVQGSEVFQGGLQTTEQAEM